MLQKNGIWESRQKAIAYYMRSLLSKQALFWLLSLFLIPSTAVAQIIPDSSLGTESSVVNSNGNRDTINGGAIRNTNLFHSFQEFNVGEGREAYFTNPNGVDNIFSRVTGNNISHIQGVLGVSGNANLYLINPNGIIFGKNASLDINGSFYGSTADSILFPNNIEFSATNPQTKLLSINIPIGLSFRDNPGEIINRSQQGLEVKSGKDFALIGGDILLESTKINVSQGGITLGSLSEAGKVVFTSDRSLIFPENVTKGDILITNTLNQNTESPPISLILQGGKFLNIEARNLVLNNTGILLSINNNNSDNTIEKNININANSILLNQGLITTRIAAPGERDVTGKIGDITLNANSINVINNSSIASRIISRESGDVQGEIGNTTLNADSVDFNNQSSIASRIVSRKSGDVNGTIGNINLNANSVNFKDESSITSNIISQDSGNILGTTGDINLNANFIDFNNESSITSAIISEKLGNILGAIGNTTVNTNSLDLNNQSSINYRIISQESGNIQGVIGNTSLNANSLDLSNNSRIFIGIISEELGNIQGKIGSFTIDADRINFNNNSFIFPRLFAKESGNIQGQIGNVTLNADSIVFSDNSRITYRSVGENVGDISGKLGNIIVNADSLILNSGSRILSSTTSSQNAANLIFNIDNLIRVEGSTIVDVEGQDVKQRSAILTLTDFGSGNAGNITIKTSELELLNGGQISGNNFREQLVENPVTGKLERSAFDRSRIGTGNAGNVDITAYNITLENQGGIATLSRTSKGGNINLKVDNLLSLANRSDISATAGIERTSGDGGNIDIEAKFIIAFPNQNNDITANAFEGLGGKIKIQAEGIFGLQPGNSTIPNSTNDIDASSEFGLSGIVNIQQPDVNPTSGLVELTSEVVDGSDLITQNVCAQTVNSEFANIGKGGLPANPNGVLAGETVEIGLVSPVSEEAEEYGDREAQSLVNERVTQKITRKPPARGWIWHEDGSVELVAYNPDQLGEPRTWHNQKGC